MPLFFQCVMFVYQSLILSLLTLINLGIEFPIYVSRGTGIYFYFHHLVFKLFTWKNVIFYPESVQVARKLVKKVGGRFSKELGIYVDSNDAEVERWFLATTFLSYPSDIEKVKLLFKVGIKQNTTPSFIFGILMNQVLFDCKVKYLFLIISLSIIIFFILLIAALLVPLQR